MIETHAHLDSEKYDEDRDRVIEEAFKHGIKLIINVTSDLASLDKVKALSDKYEQIYMTVGIQPHTAYEVNNDILELINTMAKEKKVVAIGEIGLDYHYNFSLPEIQRKVFRQQIRLAKKLNLPLAIHTREAFEDTINILKEEKVDNIGGVIHCFTEDLTQAKTYTDMGFYLGIGGVVTFKGAKSLQQAVENIPLNRIILETDCPYMTPAPHRGKRNEPSYIRFVAEKIADLKKIDIEEVKKETTKNATELFHIGI
jgi:TatD DNase family protein